MEFSQNNNIFQYINHKSVRKLKKQIGGSDLTNKSYPVPDNDNILLMKIYLKIYIRLFLYIQYKLNKKFITGNGINNPNRSLHKRALIDAMDVYREDHEMQRHLQSTDQFFIRPLFESMCRDNYSDICIQYFNSFILPKKDLHPEGVKELMEEISNRVSKLTEKYGDLENNKDLQNILASIQGLVSDYRLSQREFVKLMLSLIHI